MPKAKLDHAFCHLARCEDGKKKTDYYDEAVTGFVLECRSTGGKTYYLRYDQDGRQKQVKLAAFGDAPFAQIKKKAEKLRSEVVLGDDPAAAKTKARMVPTYAELAAQHIADARLHQKSYKTTIGYLNTHAIPRWGRSRLTEIDTRAVAQWLASKREAGLAEATVTKIAAVFGRSYELGAKWGVPGADKNPTRGLPRRPLNNARERFLTAEEAARLIEAAKASKNKQLPAIISLLLLCGMRVSELLSARWEHVDVERRSLFVPTSKSGRSRHVPLAQAALAVIEGVPRLKGAIFLFPNPADPKKHITTIKHSWQTAREAASLQDTRIHDLRHTSASAMAGAGIDLLAIGRVLGHASYQSTQRYSHLAADRLLAAVEAGAAKLALTA